MLSEEYASSIPSLLKMIIKSNKYNKVYDIFDVDPSCTFQLCLGTDFSNTFKYEISKDSTISPFIVTENRDQQIIEDRFKDEQIE